jgi:hypothetical protein
MDITMEIESSVTIDSVKTKIQDRLRFMTRRAYLRISSV